VKVLITTDSFPPNAGGSGWSTFELARGLAARGHQLEIVQPRPGTRHDATREYGGFTVHEIAAPAPNLPFVRNYFKNERLWARLERVLADRLRTGDIEVIHTQHVLTTVPSIRAGLSAGTPVVATVRDYWPVCYWSTLIYDEAAETLCEACTVANMRRCLRPRAGAAWPVALPLIPYMRGNLARKRTGLAGADAVIAVSTTIASDLEARAPELASTRIVQIPNPVDVAGIRSAAAAAVRPLAEPYVLYSGKLEANKGADLLVGVARAAALSCPLVIVGDGRLKSSIESDAARSGVDVRMLGWLAREQSLAWMRHASALVFPSRGPESLSRVLLEASALGVPIAAIHTGGTADIVRHEVTGLLSRTAEGLATDLARLMIDRPLGDRLGAAARAHVDATFDQRQVVARIEALYTELVSSRSRGVRA
jgi:glycosyltransferase involved in cell wall biosynthesis